MQKQFIHTILSMLITAIVMVCIFASHSFDVASPKDGMINNAPVPGLSYAGGTSAITITPVFPFYLVTLLYAIVQFFVLSNIKTCYGSFKTLIVIVYIIYILITVPFILVPSIMAQYTKLLVAGLNPLFEKILYVPLYFQIWVWVDIIVRVVLGKRQTVGGAIGN